ncbi:MAG TPA: VOC family protein [Pyrinomonadaceae bacterium]|jgi:catechol 2,3-dioxygenase-like lactoylglutathione lyase family enzyme
MNRVWPDELPVVQVRVARPTRSLQELIRFYCEGLGLAIVGSFTAHAGYSGVMIGLPGSDYHLEFTEREEPEADYAPPSRDNLLVFYIPERAALERVAARLAAMGYASVAPENPYWHERGVTIEDPDGWRVVLMNTSGI